MATDHRPQITGDDHAIWRKVHLIPFNVVIPPEERDGDLPEKLRKELPGILNWAIEGAVRWTREGPNPPKEVLQATKEYQSEMDTFSRFCNEMLRQESGSTVPKRGLIKTYEFWCSIEGGENLNPAGFTQRMKQIGFKDGRSKNTRLWTQTGPIPQASWKFVSSQKRALGTCLLMSTSTVKPYC